MTQIAQESSIKVINIQDQYAAKFSDSALTALGNTKSQLVSVENEEATYAVFLSLRVKEAVLKGLYVELLIDAVNEFAAAGILRGALCTLSQVDVVHHEDAVTDLLGKVVENPRTEEVVYIFPHVTDVARAKEIAGTLMTPEGLVGEISPQ